MPFRFQASRLALTAAVGALLLSVAPADAQTSEAVESRNYAPADFARFAPQTAYDMLVQVPGFAIRQATVERGLGQATGNVLLNGERISNKSDDIVAQLRRVPAGSVVRIEIRDGATLGIPGLSGQVANVVSRATGVKGQYSWRPEVRQYFTAPLLTRFDVSVSGEAGPIEYTFGLENQSSRSGAGGDTTIFNGAGQRTETRYDVWTGAFEQPRASARFVYRGPNESLGNLNLSYRDFRFDYREDGFRRNVALPDRERDVFIVEDGYDYEIGGDYRFKLGPGQLKLIGLLRHGAEDERTDVLVDWADGRPRTGDAVARDSEERERVARAEYQWKDLGGDLEVSGEYAFNALDGVTRLFSLNSGGGFDETPFPGGSAEVEEDRYEVIASYGRTLSPTLSFQIAAGGEYSELAQLGGGGQTRTFWRPKGQLTAVWQRDPKTRANLRLQRKVGQLNFFDFLASVNLSNEQESEANPDLVPPQSWEAEAEIARAHGAWGNSTLRLYGHLVEDIVDFVPIGASGEAIGNLDSAVRYGVEYRGTHLLDAAGLKGVRLDSRVWLQNSSVEDPLFKTNRAISNSLQQLVSLGGRHDVPGTNWAYGGTISHQRYAPVYRLSEVSRSWEFTGMLSAFVEHKAVFGHTVRFSAANLLYGESYFDRTGHSGRRTGPISFVEIRDRTVGPIFTLEIRGRF